MCYIKPIAFQILDLIWETRVRDQHEVPLSPEKLQHTGYKAYPEIRFLFTDYVGTNVLEQCAAIRIFLPIPAEERLADILDKIAVMGDKHPLAVGFKRLL